MILLNYTLDFYKNGGLYSKCEKPMPIGELNCYIPAICCEPVKA